MSIRARIEGVGHAVPARILTNDELSTMVDTNDEWIYSRTGIRQRHIAGPEDTAFTLSLVAAQNALANSGVAAADLDLVIVGTVTGDMQFPSTSCLLQDALGATKAGAFDVGAACAGFIYSIANATAMIESGMAKHVLVVGVDLLTKIIDWTDRSTCVLFGDGAGAVVMSAVEGSDRGVLKSVLLSDGSGAKHIHNEVGGSRYPHGSPQAEGRCHSVYMNGNEVYRFAVQAIGDACLKVLAEAGMTPDQVDLFVPHQANIRIIESARERLNLPKEKVFVNVDRLGNTSAASIPIGLSEAAAQGVLKPGMIVLTVGFGAGLVWGANLIRW